MPEEISSITGQKAVPTQSKKAISNFKLRENMPIGVRVTLRGDKMFEFLDRLVNVALPRVRDFRGVSAKGFDGRGNYAFGLKEQIVFPEIEYDKVDAMRGMDIIICTTAANDDQAAFGNAVKRPGDVIAAIVGDHDKGIARCRREPHGHALP